VCYTLHGSSGRNIMVNRGVHKGWWRHEFCDMSDGKNEVS
jgi:hypothetical protein